LFTFPFSIEIVKIAAHIQMDHIEIQNDSNSKRTFNEVGLMNFYTFWPVRYVENRRFACKIKSMFSSTYLCEQQFSLMNSNKSSIRSRLTNIHLNSVLKVASFNNISPEIEKLVKEKRYQTSPKRIINMFHMPDLHAPKAG
jgi:17beta-estradiol 17-dehydrogenase/3beta-hydroxysteroid 3-dehydrogenase/mitotic-spindle organizing protein 1